MGVTMRIRRVYTRTGDRGTTRLTGGVEVPKDHIRVAAYGTVDELNSILGLARTFNDDGELEAKLRILQNELFDLGADLSTPAAKRWPEMHRVGDTEVTRLEAWCDTLNEDLGPLKEFILPGGGPVGAFLHQARTVCRRAERLVVTLMREEDDIGEGCLRYLNRLSDFLFVLARWAAKQRQEPEYLWERPTSR